MKTAGIIAEYNPFHKGHEYHIEETRRLTGADFVVTILSGDYVQRGTPALLDKYSRAETALQCGADLVLELPLPYAASSAEYFALGGVTLLDKLGCVDYLCFGSECGDAEKIKAAASYLSEEPFEYKQLLQKYLMQGLSFPSAQEAALFACTDSETAALLSSPNNRLGIEYCKVLLRRKSRIKPVTVTRKGSGYHNGNLTGEYSSATALRKFLLENTKENSMVGDSAISEKDTGLDFRLLQSHIPAKALAVLQREWNRSCPITEQDFSLLLHYKLLQETKASLECYLDMTPDLADKILKYLPQYTSYRDFCMLLKSKELTYARISRCLLHILLDIKSEHLECYKETDYVPYARMLGFRKSATPLLHEIKEHSSLPLISKLADAPKLLDEKVLQMLQREIIASHIYEAVKTEKYSDSAIKNEYSREMIVL